jgi:hypothetical protein
MKIKQFILALLFPFASMVLLRACSSQEKSRQIAPSTTSVWKPTWAKGFKIHEKSDSSIDIVLFNLESKTDTLKIIHCKRKKENGWPAFLQHISHCLINLVDWMY